MIPKHPEYNLESNMWTLWRRAYEGGQLFRITYLQQYSNRESPTDFQNRAVMSPIPAFAKAAIDEVKNAIYQRISDVHRSGGSPAYQAAIKGEDGGVDGLGSSMNSFIGIMILIEMLVMRKVAVRIDMPEIPENATKLTKLTPTMCQYPIEDILNWQTKNGELVTIALNHRSYQNDKIYDLPEAGQVEQHKYTKLANGTVKFEVFTTNNDTPTITKILNIPTIPVVIFELNHSLMQDIADYQVALMNLMSSDINYCRQANFPFYTEQTDGSEASHLKQVQDQTKGTNTPDGGRKVQVGSLNGRQYGMDVERPGFIHPSSEPLKASMEKQEQMKQEIRQLVALAIGSLQPKMQSAESKSQDQQGLEAGLSHIALVLQDGEQRIAKIFAQFEQSNQIATVKYPERYSLISEKDRIAKIDQLKSLRNELPSRTAKKAINKSIAHLAVGHKISLEEMAKIEKEIEDAIVDDVNPANLIADVENGVASPETVSLARGYPAGEAKKAEEAHTRKLAAIAQAQMPHDQGLGQDTSKLQKQQLAAKDQPVGGREGTGEKQ